MTPFEQLDELVAASHERARKLEDLLDSARNDRAKIFAAANDRGVTSGDLARRTGLSPSKVLSEIKVGRGLLRTERFVRDGGAV